MSQQLEVVAWSNGVGGCHPLPLINLEPHIELVRLADANAEIERLAVELASAKLNELAANEAAAGLEQQIIELRSDLATLEQESRQMRARNERLEAELETERLRLAACGVAALGYFNGCKDEYRSASLDDVLRLREKADGEKPANGLKNHQIAGLVSAMANELHRRWQLPQMLRQVISGIVCDFLNTRGLMIDSGKSTESEADQYQLVPKKATPEICNALRTGSRADVPSDALCEIRWAAALAAAPKSYGWPATHIKTGNVYQVVGEAINCTNAQDGQVMVIYQRDGQTFVREVHEFQDKFEAAK